MDSNQILARKVRFPINVLINSLAWLVWPETSRVKTNLSYSLIKHSFWIKLFSLSVYTQWHGIETLSVNWWSDSFSCKYWINTVISNKKYIRSRLVVDTLDMFRAIAFKANAFRLLLNRIKINIFRKEWS